MRKSLCMALLATILLPACATPNRHQSPAPALPEAWSLVDGASSSRSAGEAWWSLFQDPVLDSLVADALQQNHDLEIAAARILEAEATLGITDADRYPVITANGTGSRSGLSKVSATPLFGGMPRQQNSVRWSLDASYEVDVWGKFRHATAASRAELLAAQAARDTVRLTLTAEVVQQYFNLLALDAQVSVVEEVLQSRTDSIALLRLRFESGMGSELEIRQAQAEFFAPAVKPPKRQIHHTPDS